MQLDTTNALRRHPVSVFQIRVPSRFLKLKMQIQTQSLVEMKLMLKHAGLKEGKTVS